MLLLIGAWSCGGAPLLALRADVAWLRGLRLRNPVGQTEAERRHEGRQPTARGLLIRKKRAKSPTPKLLDGAAEAKLIAMRLSKPPAGFGHWTLRLLADQMVELEIVESISAETVRQTLKKTA